MRVSGTSRIVEHLSAGKGGTITQLAEIGGIGASGARQAISKARRLGIDVKKVRGVYTVDGTVPRRQRARHPGSVANEQVWMSGEWLSNAAAGAKVGKAGLSVRRARQELVRQGHRFEHRPGLGGGEWRYVGPPTAPEAPQGPLPAPVSAGTPVRAPRGHSKVVAPPSLDSQLVVNMLQRGDDGTLRIGVRNGDVTWLCEVVGQVAGG